MSIHCPFCGDSIPEAEATFHDYRIPPDHDYLFSRYNDGGFFVTAYICPTCHHLFVRANKEGTLDHFSTWVYPQAVYRHFPDYIPAAIRQDYEEACKIKSLSPKAAATLCRRCLQGMLRDFWKVKPDTLHNEILALKDTIPTSQWNAMDALRQLGNIGAHMEHDVNLIVDVEPEEADLLIRLIERLLDAWYVTRHSDEELYQAIVCSNADAQAARKTE